MTTQQEMSHLWSSWPPRDGQQALVQDGRLLALRRQLLLQQSCRSLRYMGAHAEVPGRLFYGHRRTQVGPYGASITRYHHFLRLKSLFPDINPHALHGVLELCNGDFIRTVDNIIFTRRINNEFRRKLVLENSRTGLQFDNVNQHFPMSHPGTATPTRPYNPYSNTGNPTSPVGGTPLPPFEMLRNAAFGRTQSDPVREQRRGHIGFQQECSLPSLSSRARADLMKTTAETKVEPSNSDMALMEGVSSRETTTDLLLTQSEAYERPRRSNRRRLFPRKYQEHDEDRELSVGAVSGVLPLMQPEVSCEPKFNLNEHNKQAMQFAKFCSLNYDHKLDFIKPDYNSSPLTKMCSESKPELNSTNKYVSLPNEQMNKRVRSPVMNSISLTNREINLLKYAVNTNWN